MMDLLVFAVFSCWLVSALAASADEKDYDSDFRYDYESLRIGGLIFAVVLFLMGIALIATRKCNCSKSKDSAPGAPDAAPRDAPYSVKAE